MRTEKSALRLLSIELGLKKIKLLAAPVKYPSLGGFDLEIIGFEQ